MRAGPGGHGATARDGASLLLVGHGSRNPRSSAALRGLSASVAALVPDVTVRLAFLELSEPLLEDVLPELPGAVTVVPLLLGNAFHARLDLPRRLRADGTVRPAPLRMARPLGPDPSLAAALSANAGQLTGADSFVLLGTGSSDPTANAAVAATAAAVGRATGARVRTAFVTCAPGPEQAIAALRAAGSDRPGVLPYVLAPGLLLSRGLERAAHAGAVAVAPTLAHHHAVARLVLARAAEARPLSPAERSGNLRIA